MTWPPADPPTPPTGGGPGEQDSIREAVDIELVAAALRSQHTDLPGLFRVLADTLPDSLPPGWVQVERDRSLADRIAGRPGKPASVSVQVGDTHLRLASEHSTVVAESRHVVRGVVLSRRRIGVDQWVRALASALATAAQQDAQARTALARLLGSQ